MLTGNLLRILSRQAGSPPNPGGVVVELKGSILPWNRATPFLKAGPSPSFLFPPRRCQYERLTTALTLRQASIPPWDQVLLHIDTPSTRTWRLRFEIKINEDEI